MSDPDGADSAPPRERRRQARRKTDPAPAGTARLAPGEAPPGGPTADPGAFTAHLYGQDGRARGLKGGPETLKAARSTYLGAEWSGPADRRPRPGRIARTDV